MIIVSTHILEEVEAVCSRAVIIARGQLLADGTPEDLVARAPNHNAVVVSLSSEHVQSAAQLAKAMAGVQNVEILNGPDGSARLRVQPINGSVLVAPLSDALKAANMDIQQLYVERGTLDDVFREITTSSDTKEAAHA